MLTKPTSCLGCPLSHEPHGSMLGYVPAWGSGTSGVLIVLEAAGSDEAACGQPTVGKAGQYLWNALARSGISRDVFRVHNVLSCQPPDNKLLQMAYTEEAIRHCRPNLLRTITEHKAFCARTGKTPVILALGKFAFSELMALAPSDPIWKEDYYSYAHWSPVGDCWLVAAAHPSHIMQGNHQLQPTLVFAVQRALEIASEPAFSHERHGYLLDPSPLEFDRWASDYLKAAADAPNDTFLSYDIETPYKSGRGEAEVAVEDQDDYRILRLAFCYRPGDSVSVRWDAEYLPTIAKLLGSTGYGVGWNNSGYDDSRLSHQLPLNLTSFDGMLAWHVLNSSMPKNLGFVTPFYWQNTAMWKHLSSAEPAFYNAKDADAALRCWLGIKRDLEEAGQWSIFKRHVMELNKVLGYMSRKGVLLDQKARASTEELLGKELERLELEIQAAVPHEVRLKQLILKTPADTTGLVQVPGQRKTKQCTSCQAIDVSAAHFKSVGKKKLKLGEPENPCVSGKPVRSLVPDMIWARLKPFRLSKQQLSNYQAFRKHKQIKKRKAQSHTYDLSAIKKLVQLYPTDPLYPIIGQYRATQKLLGTYVGVTDRRTKSVGLGYQLQRSPLGSDEWIREPHRRTMPDGSLIEVSGKVLLRPLVYGGMPIGQDGRVHTVYTHNPSTLRLASQQPNMQNLPRPAKDPSDPRNRIRGLIVPGPGQVFLARDFSGIEAVLVGYDAQAPGYIRLARRDVHSFYTAYALYELDKSISANDLPLLGWDDEKLFGRLGEIKKEFKEQRNNLFKHLVHAINFGQSASGSQAKIYEETDHVYEVKLIAKLMDIYRALFPEIPRWQQRTRMQADRDGYLTNAFGYRHRFSHVFGWKERNGHQERVAGDDAEAVLAFRPQSNAAGIMKEALLTLYTEHFEEAGQYLRMTIHDEIFTEVPEALVETVDGYLARAMEAPIRQMPLPEHYNMGSHLSILSESKAGGLDVSWADMH